MNTCLSTYLSNCLPSCLPACTTYLPDIHGHHTTPISHPGQWCNTRGVSPGQHLGSGSSSPAEPHQETHLDASWCDACVGTESSTPGTACLTASVTLTLGSWSLARSSTCFRLEETCWKPLTTIYFIDISYCDITKLPMKQACGYFGWVLFWYICFSTM